MKFLRLATYALGLSAGAAAVTGCSSNGASPFGVPSGVPPNGFPLVPVTLDEQNKNNKGVVQYVVTFSAVLGYDYPKSDTPIGEMRLEGGQTACADILYGAAKRDYWVVQWGPHNDNDLEEFALGSTKRIKTLTLPAGVPSSCAMDPTTGNMAAAMWSGAAVVIFPHASGSGTVMTTPLSEAYYDGYDDHGNLFVDGTNGSLAFELVELKKGGSTFQTITTSNTHSYAGAVQWDGTYLTIGDVEGGTTSSIYRYRVSGTKATLKGTVSLAAPSVCQQTWIGSGGVIFCPDESSFENVAVYEYPAGGSPIAVLTTNTRNALGVVEVRK